MDVTPTAGSLVMERLSSAQMGFSKIPPGATVTAMLCLEPEGVMDQADAYMSAFMQGKRFRITDDRLEILDSGDAAKLVFVKEPPLLGSPIDLEGTAWRLLEEGDTDGDVACGDHGFPGRSIGHRRDRLSQLRCDVPSVRGRSALSGEIDAKLPAVMAIMHRE